MYNRNNNNFSVSYRICAKIPMILMSYSVQEIRNRPAVRAIQNLKLKNLTQKLYKKHKKRNARDLLFTSLLRPDLRAVTTSLMSALLSTG
jgi:hypothetical protein